MRATVLLLRLRLRRERIVLPLWIVAIVGLLAAAGGAVASEFAEEAQRASLVALAISNPAFLFLRGLPDGTSVGALVVFQTFAFLAVLAALMNTFLVVRHTRADEERGRTELLLATPVPRTRDLTVVLALATAANLVVAVGCFLVGLALGFGLTAAMLIGASLGLIGLAFAGIAALVAQVMPSPRGANGVAAALVGLAYLVRGVGDALGTPDGLTRVDPHALSLLSPIGWAQATRPFSDQNAAGVWALLGLALTSIALALMIRARRDLGASLIPERAGRAGWPSASATGLAVRLQGGSLVGWMVGTAVLGAIAGFLAPVVAAAIADNDQLGELISQLAPGLETNTSEAFTVGLLGIAGVLATAAGVQAMTRLRLDEAEGRAELLLATPLRRVAWVARQLAVSVFSMVLVALVAGLSAGVGLAITEGDPQRIPTALGTVAAHLPAGVVFIALALLLFGVVPRAMIALSWGALGAGLVLGQLGDLLRIPEGVQSISPFRHTPAVPIEPGDPVAALVLVATAAGVAAVGVALVRRRDMPL